MDFYEDILKESSLDIGLVICNAGIYRPGPFVQIESDIMESMLDTNVYHVAAMIKKFLPKLLKRGK